MIIQRLLIEKQMKKTLIISALIVTTVIAVVSCSSKREPGRIYMPDMAYSRAYESYALRDSAIFTTNPADAGHKIFYNNLPPAGTIKRGDLFPFNIAHDMTFSTIDSNQALIGQLAALKNPLGPLTTADSIETSRLFNINCAVCHGAKAEANGPLAPKLGGVKSIIAASPKFSDGRIFYVMEYGQNNMGSYASQLSREQRWRIVQYIRTLEPKTAATPAAAKDSVTVAKK